MPAYAALWQYVTALRPYGVKGRPSAKQLRVEPQPEDKAGGLAPEAGGNDI